MPRIATYLIRRARYIHPFLPHLLKPCRDLRTAFNEFRWLRQHVTRITSLQGLPKPQKGFLKALCKERGRGRPLQYIIGSEYFGELEIFCRSGVLIPRPETADITTALADRLLNNTFFDKDLSLPPHLRILDICSGSGCMSLLLAYILSNAPVESGINFAPTIRSLGIDISRRAVNLSRANLGSQYQTGQLKPETAVLSYARADVFDSGTETIPALSDLLEAGGEEKWDIVLSNPPYVSYPKFWDQTTTRSVRNFEPREALLPPQMGSLVDGDSFYPRLLDKAVEVDAKVLVMEVGDDEQAMRVARIAKAMDIWQGVEVWRDGVGADGMLEEGVQRETIEDDIEVFGNPEREGRAVVCWRNDGEGWLKL